MKPGGAQRALHCVGRVRRALLNTARRSGSLAYVKVTGGDFIDHPRNGYARGVFRLAAHEDGQLKRVSLSLEDDAVSLRLLRDDPVSPLSTGAMGALRWAAVGAILGGVPGAIGGAILGASASIRHTKHLNRQLKQGQQAFAAKFRGGYRLEGEMDARALTLARLRFLQQKR